MKDTILVLKDYLTKDDILYSQFLKFKELVPDGYNQEDNKEELDAEFLTIRMLDIFYDLKPKDMRDLKQSQLVMLIEKITNVLKLPKSELKRIVKHNGVLYGMIPNFLEITVGELIDLDKQYEALNYYNIASIIYRPIIGDVNKQGEYIIEDYQGYSDNFNDISLSLVEGFISFFEQSFHLLSQITQISTRVQK